MGAGPSVPAPSSHAAAGADPAARHVPPVTLSRPSWRAHIPALLFFAVLAIVLTWPLASDLSSQVPGVGPDDNVVFLWNLVWMRHALAHGFASVLHTPLVFNPGGVDMVLHTHTALNAFIGATVLGWLSPAAALNVLLLAACTLNGFLASLLAYRVCGHRTASIVSGIFFAASPTMTNHLFGHFNFYSAWVLLLFVVTFLRALDGPSRTRAVAAGASLAAVAYTDYYYFIYASVFALCVAAHRWAGVAFVIGRARARVLLDRVLVGVAIACGAVAVLIALTGGLVIERPIRISMTNGLNIRAVATAAALWWLWRRWPLSITGRVPASLPMPELRVASLALITCLTLMSPILFAAFEAWRQGDYVSQTYFWRSSPAGVDLATLAAGNPFHPVWGAAVTRFYAERGMFAFDGPLWMGLAPLALVLTRRTWLDARDTRLWLLVGLVFLFWSLGPFLIVFGVNTGLPMPQFLMRFVPVVSNARIPGHAVIFVYLAVAVLLASAMARTGFGRPAAAAAVALYVLLDFAPMPFPMHRLDVPAIYQQLATLPPGAVVEVPLGMRDGFGMEGRLDPRDLFYQSVHGKPLTGGYIARLPPSARRRMHETPVLDALLRLSDGRPLQAPLPPGAEARNALRQAGVTYVVLNRREAPADAIAFVLTWPMRLIARSGERELYELE